MAIKAHEFWDIFGVSQHYEFEQKLRACVLDKEAREAFYVKLLDLQPDLSKDSFRTYFELYSAERKSNMQDFTPSGIARLVANLGQAGDKSFFDPTAGTGALIIEKWHEDRIKVCPYDYLSHEYFYMAGEVADNVIPYLIHNLAIRGMNAIVIHGDCLMKSVKQIYFIQNDTDDMMAFSSINVLPHSKEVTRYFGINEWLEEAIEHVESHRVNWRVNDD